MRLKTKTDYCIRVLIYLQMVDRRVKIQEIADNFEISKNHLSVAVNRLSELGYVHSVQGPKGGIEFNKEFGKKTVAELVLNLEEFAIVECFDPATNTCSLSPKCKLKNIFSDANLAFIEELKKHKISDLT